MNISRRFLGKVSMAFAGLALGASASVNTAAGLLDDPLPTLAPNMSVGMDFKGVVTMLNGFSGVAFHNSSSADEERWRGFRTPVEGHMVLEFTPDGMRGTATFEPFLFIGTLASGRDISFRPVGETEVLGVPTPTNTLLLANMSFDFGSFFRGIPVSLVVDMGNLDKVLRSATLGQVIGGALRGESDNTVFTLPDGTKTTLPVGPAAVVTTSWNTTDVDTDGDGNPGPLKAESNPSGTFPLLFDTVVDTTNGDIGIAGSPIKAVAFVNFSPAFDFIELTVTCVNALLGGCTTDGVPLPAVPLSPQPMEPLQDAATKLVTGLGQ